MDFSRHKFLIIAGTTKAGSTSLFNYMANHPQICPSRAKETRFFLDPDYPLPSELRHSKDGAAAYFSFFDSKECQDGEKWRLEATPDYLYSPNTARLLRETLPDARFIFILREPVARLCSFYRFGRAMGEVPRAMTFEGYVEHQRKETACRLTKCQKHPALSALPHGRYSRYLQPFLELFPRSRIYVTFCENLARDPGKVMREICRFAQIDEQYFENYTFEVVNRGISVRSPGLHDMYWRGKEKLRSSLRSAPKIRSVLRVVGRRIDSVYRRANVTGQDPIVISPSTEEFIHTYYSKESARLKELLGLEVPWSVSSPDSKLAN